MPIRPDLVVYSRNNQPSLVVEVKNKRDASAEWATEFRRNLLVHGGFPPAPYFMLVTPDWMFLWSDTGNRPNSPPTAKSATRSTFQLFLEVLEPDHFDEPVLEIMTQAWLSTLADTWSLPQEIRARDPWLIETGLHESIKGGRIELEPAA